MKVKCGERGTFNAELAAKALIELYNKVNIKCTACNINFILTESNKEKICPTCGHKKN